MGSVGSPNPWGPYSNYKDCSQGICSIYCPQWCYIIFPPPPPDDNSGTDFSPLIIAVIGILASTFLLVCYYTILSRYCRRRGDHNINPESDNDQNRDEMNQEALQVVPAGLDDAQIKSITVSKYKKGLVEGTDCSVCLSEFQEDESLRLLPKCNHAFHLPCIDTWLKSHSSCPLCRSNIASNANSLAPHDQLPAPIPVEAIRSNISISALEYHSRNDSVLIVHDLESGMQQNGNVSTIVSIHEIGDHKEGDSEEKDDNIIEIRSQGVHHQQFRRSVSLDSSSRQGNVSIADILRISEEEEEDDDDRLQRDNYQFLSREYGKSNNSLMERSISTGRFMFSRHGKGRDSINIDLPN